MADRPLEQRSTSLQAQAQALRWGQLEDTSTVVHVAVAGCLWPLTAPPLESSELAIWAPWAAEPCLPASLVGVAVSAAAEVLEVGRRLPRLLLLLPRLVRRLLLPQKMKPLRRLWTRSRVN